MDIIKSLKEFKRKTSIRLHNLAGTVRSKKIAECGSPVWISKGCTFSGNIKVGNNVSIGQGVKIVSSVAKVEIHDNVLIAPEVMIYSGDHITDGIGKHIIEFNNRDKLSSPNPEKYDKDIVIEAGCWIGARAIILKGVTIGRGSVVGAGAVVTKDVPPYSIYVGAPEARTFCRFTEEEILRHEEILRERNVTIE